jgi:hypothetical protein
LLLELSAHVRPYGASAIAEGCIHLRANNNGTIAEQPRVRSRKSLILGTVLYCVHGGRLQSSGDLRMGFAGGTCFKGEER